MVTGLVNEHTLIVDPDKLEYQLEQAVVTRLNQGVLVDEVNKQIVLPKLLDWYKQDLAPSKLDEDVLRWCLCYLRGHAYSVIEKMLNNTKEWSIKYRKYLWEFFYYRVPGDYETVKNSKLEFNSTNSGCGDWLEIHFPGLGWKHMYFQVEDNDVDARVVYRSGQGSPNAMSYEVSLKSVKKVTESKLKYGFIVTTEEKGVESLPTDRKQIHIQAKTAELRQKWMAVFSWLCGRQKLIADSSGSAPGNSTAQNCAQVWKVVPDEPLSKITQAMEKTGCNATTRDEYQQTILHIAASENRTDLVFLLLSKQYNADVNAVDLHGWSCLHCAACNGSLEVLELLLTTSRADVNAQTIHGNSALHYFVGAPCLDPFRFEQVFELFVHRRADLNLANQSGDTPLHIASSTPRKLCVALLLQNGANPDIQNGAGETALNLAVRQGHESIVELLVRNGAIKDEDMRRAQINIAREYAREDIVDLLGRVKVDDVSSEKLWFEDPPFLPAEAIETNPFSPFDSSNPFS